MKKLGIRTHGFIDYLIGLLLIIIPGMFSFSQPEEFWALIVTGLFILTYSLFTDYRFGVFKIIPAFTHLLLDILVDMLLTLSPWLFEFADGTWAVHVITGLLIIFISMVTNPRPVYRMIRYRRKKLHKPLYRTYSIR